MKILLLIVGMMLISSTAIANMYLTSPANPGVTYYNITGLGTYITNPVAAPTDGSLSMDITTLGVGNYTTTISACNNWGDCSAPITFTIQRPAIPNVPVPSLVKK